MGASAVFAKLNLKDHDEIVVLNAPKSFEAEIDKLDGVQVRRKIPSGRPVSFALAFVTRQAELDAIGSDLARSSSGDSMATS